jgi:hypothetical protein
MKEFETEFTVSLRMVDQHSPGCPNFGIAPVTITVGGAPVDGIAMVVKTRSGVTEKYVTSDWEHAQEWYRGRGATQGDLDNLLEALEAETEYRIEVNVSSDKDEDTWSGNAIRFSDPDEAKDNAKDLFMRWTSVRFWRVIDENDKVIHSNKEKS